MILAHCVSSCDAHDIDAGTSLNYRADKDKIYGKLSVKPSTTEQVAIVSCVCVTELFGVSFAELECMFSYSDWRLPGQAPVPSLSVLLILSLVMNASYKHILSDKRNASMHFVGHIICFVFFLFQVRYLDNGPTD